MKFILLAFIFSLNLQAKTNLLLRSDISHGFNAPYDSHLLDSTPVSSPRGDVAIAFSFTQSTYTPAIWKRPHNVKRGQLIWNGQEGEKVSSLGITKVGELCFAHYDENFFLKSLVYLQNDNTSIVISNIPKTWSFASALPNNPEGACHFSVMKLNGTRQIVHADFTNQQLSTIYSPSEDVSYLFSPTSNFNGGVFFKIRVGAKGDVSEQQPDRLLSWNGSSVKVVLSDKDDDSNSSLSDFSHLISANSSGEQCFYAHGYTQLYLRQKQGSLLELPMPSGKPELFTPVINSNQNIAIRISQQQKNNLMLWYPKENTWKTILSENQVIDGDSGPLRISAIAEGPAFAGGLAISDQHVYVQVRFKDHKGFPAGNGLVQVEF